MMGIRQYLYNLLVIAFLMKTLFIMFLGLLLLISIACTSNNNTEVSTSSENKGENVHFVTSDQVKIAGRFYEASTPNRPVFVLLHMLNSDQTSYDDFVTQIMARNYHVLTFDFRGHGRSEGNIEDFIEEDYQRMLLDLIAAMSYLNTEKELFYNHKILVGASIGANIATQYAPDFMDVSYLILLSPGLVYRGVDIDQSIIAYDRPLEIVVSEGDKYSADSSRVLMDSSPSADKTLRTFGGITHGTNLLTEKLMNDLLEDVKIVVP